MEEGSCYANGEADEDREALEQLRFVFNLCDGDQDGVISVDEFRQIGRDHFDKTKVHIVRSVYLAIVFTSIAS